MDMKPINIAELKNNLSLYLNKVRRGEEIVVRDRNTPIAKIIPWQGEQDDELNSLASRGLLRLGQGEIDDQFWHLPAPRVSAKALHDAVKAERADD
ncbi:MAG TPA: type II toxin-antitoxin system prevent-host-death family antitoxin [Candidatus Obscuribacterales bacterium]